jgi:hypothetical protein
VTCVSAATIAVVGMLTVRPIPTTMPVSLAKSLDDGRPHRVLNDYNTGGLILAFGGPRVRVAVDGRADYFGATFLDRYTDLMRMTPGWHRLFDELNPDAALISTKSPLNEWLPANGWTRIRTQGAFSLWQRDSANG